MNNYCLSSKIFPLSQHVNTAESKSDIILPHFVQAASQHNSMMTVVSISNPVLTKLRVQ